MRQIRSLRRHDFKELIKLSTELFSQHNDADFPFTEAGLLQQLNGFLANRQCYFRGLFEEGRLVAWMLSVPGHGHPHSLVTGMSQLYFHSGLSGVAGAHALVDVHEDFFKYVERKQLHVAVTSSVLPNSDVFVRLLSRAGWKPVGHGRLTRVTRWHPGHR